IVLAIVDAAAAFGIAGAAARAVLAPDLPRLRPYRMEDETAGYLYVWIRRFAFVVIFGLAAIEAATALRLPADARHSLLSLLAMVAALLVAVLILQNRASVAAAIRGDGAAGPLGGMRRRLAELWHILALAYVAILFLIFFLGIEGGF